MDKNIILDLCASYINFLYVRKLYFSSDLIFVPCVTDLKSLATFINLSIIVT